MEIFIDESMKPENFIKSHKGKASRTPEFLELYEDSTKEDLMSLKNAIDFLLMHKYQIDEILPFAVIGKDDIFLYVSKEVVNDNIEYQNGLGYKNNYYIDQKSWFLLFSEDYKIGIADNINSYLQKIK